MIYENYRIIEPVVMRIKYPEYKDVFKNELKNLDIDFTAECDNEKPVMIIEVYNDSQTYLNQYLYEWLVMVADIPGMNKLYPSQLDLLGLEESEVGYIEYMEDNKYNLVSLLPINMRYDLEKGTTLYLFELHKYF